MRVLVKADVPSWAFARRAAAYHKYPPEGWDVQAADDGYQRFDEDWNAILLLNCLASPLNYGDIRYARMVASHAWLHDYDATDWRTRGCNESRCLSNVKRAVGRASSVVVYNTHQRDVLREVIHNRIVLAPYTIDCELFNPESRPDDEREKLRVGWCYQVSGGLRSFKGLSDVLVPVIAALGDQVEWSVMTPDSASCLGPLALAEWYRSLDVFLCTSSGEGGPQGPFEAAACGAVVVSTDVGQVSDWGLLREAGLIVPTYRNAQEAAGAAGGIIERIRALDADRSLLSGWRERLVGDIQANWNAEIECPKQMRDIFPETA
jgi:glycosyltransferase involved in cell wall biosynthesis